MFEAFQLGPLLLRSHILFLLCGVWLSAELFFRFAVREGLRIAVLLQRAIIFLLAFLFGGRLFGILLLYRVYAKDPMQMLIFWDGIFSVTGGFCGIAIALLAFTWRQRVQFLRWLDALLPALTLLLAFDWLGRFFGSLSYGRPTDGIFGVTYESMIVRYTVPVHPVQLYYALWFFALTFLLLLMRRKKHVSFLHKDFAISNSGMVTLAGVFFSCLGVIILEFLRGDFAVIVFAKLSDFVFLALLFMSLGGIAILENKISPRYSLVNSMLVGLGTVAYLLLRPWISAIPIEWRFSQFLAVLAILGTVVYVVVHRWKYPHL